MSLNEFNHNLQKLQKILPDVCEQISDAALKNTFENTVKELVKSIPKAEKVLSESQTILSAFRSFQKESEHLQQVLGLHGIKLNTINFADIESEQQVKTVDIKRAAINNKDKDSIENLDLYYSEDQVLKELQLNLTGLEEMISQQKIVPTFIDNKRYFSKKKISLLKSMVMESSTIVIEKPVKQPITLRVKKDTSRRSSDATISDYFTDDEVMKELQIDANQLQIMIDQNKLTPTVIDSKRYFLKRKVALLRSMAMDLATIVIEKPKTKRLRFWKDKE